ncbi:hypothetical protein Taro_025129 [Colocasia esculenta]|uniref:Retrieval of early ER protein Rer1 n=1 Tax=Colocasia esculenta TaxID=4460 RepID=A0A843VGL9_COLES|nr:hypothetical protein [Colocasia esculenta]
MEGTSSAAGDASAPPVALAKWRNEFSRAFQYYLDRSTPHSLGRWMGTLAVAMVYVLRVYLVQGFYIVSYGLGIYLLNLLIGFLSPKVDPELEVLNDGPALPTRGSDEFKPFIRRLPEFKFWIDHKIMDIESGIPMFFSLRISDPGQDEPVGQWRLAQEGAGAEPLQGTGLLSLESGWTEQQTMLARFWLELG